MRGNHYIVTMQLCIPLLLLPCGTQMDAIAIACQLTSKGLLKSELSERDLCYQRDAANVPSSLYIYAAAPYLTWYSTAAAYIE